MTESDKTGAPKPRVLLVEDEEHLAFSLRFNLEAEGYEVELATTLEQARSHDPTSFDVLLLDVMLPDGNGFEFCSQLRRAGVFTPILMLTALGASEDIVTGLEVGADDYLTKPFSLGELLGRLAAILRRRRWETKKPETSETIEFGNNRVDFRSHEVVAQGEPAELTELEIRLVRFFVDRPNAVLSRGELLEGVWDMSAKTNTRTVDNFLVRLRKLFEADPAQPAHFLTVRGVGYRFVP